MPKPQVNPILAAANTEFDSMTADSAVRNAAVNAITTANTIATRLQGMSEKSESLAEQAAALMRDAAINTAARDKKAEQISDALDAENRVRQLTDDFTRGQVAATEQLQTAVKEYESLNPVAKFALGRIGYTPQFERIAHEQELIYNQYLRTVAAEKQQKAIVTASNQDLRDMEEQSKNIATEQGINELLTKQLKGKADIASTELNAAIKPVEILVEVNRGTRAAISQEIELKNQKAIEQKREAEAAKALVEQQQAQAQLAFTDSMANRLYSADKLPQEQRDQARIKATKWFSTQPVAAQQAIADDVTHDNPTPLSYELLNDGKSGAIGYNVNKVKKIRQEVETELYTQNTKLPNSGATKLSAMSQGAEFLKQTKEEQAKIAVAKIHEKLAASSADGISKYANEVTVSAWMMDNPGKYGNVGKLAAASPPETRLANMLDVTYARVKAKELSDDEAASQLQAMARDMVLADARSFPYEKLGITVPNKAMAKVDIPVTGILGTSIHTEDVNLTDLGAIKRAFSLMRAREK